MVMAVQNGSTVNGRLVALRRSDEEARKFLHDNGIKIPFVSFEGQLVTIAGCIKREVPKCENGIQTLAQRSNLKFAQQIGLIELSQDKMNLLKLKIQSIATVTGWNSKWAYSARAVLFILLGYTKVPTSAHLRVKLGIPLEAGWSDLWVMAGMQETAVKELSSTGVGFSNKPFDRRPAPPVILTSNGLSLASLPQAEEPEPAPGPEGYTISVDGVEATVTHQEPEQSPPLLSDVDLIVKGLQWEIKSRESLISQHQETIDTLMAQAEKLDAERERLRGEVGSLKQAVQALTGGGEVK